MTSNEKPPISILIADDHPLFRRGMRSLLSPIPDFKVVGEASSGEETIRLAAELQPDVILMDLQMPGGNGLAATRAILQSSPDIRILVVTLFEDDDSVFAALRAGARGYVLKDSRDEEMVRAIRAIGNREAIFSPEIATRVLGNFSSRPAAHKEIFPLLTPREREILALLVQGLSNQSIAESLSLSEKTVSNYISNIYSKLQVSSRAQAIIKAREAGMESNPKPYPDPLN
jgi:DNA-binding NarL/FixJ family response regulator